MGKTRKTKPKAAKVNPLGIPSVRDVNLDEELLTNEAHPDGAIGSIAEQLQSACLEEKMCGIQALAFISLNPQKATAIVESDIVKIVSPLLMDANQSVRNAVAGALRNISLCGIETCENLVEQDVLTPLLTLLNEYATNVEWVPVFDRSVPHCEQLDQLSDTFLQAINLVWNLCESDSIALENFNQTTVLQSFVRFLDYRVFGIDISVAVAQCLLVISEDNARAWRVLIDYTAQLVQLLTIDDTEKSVFLRTLAAAILANIPALASTHINQIFATLSHTLDVNHRLALGRLTSLLPIDEEKKNLEIEVADENNQMDEETDEQASLRRRRQDLPTENDVHVKHVGWLLEAQRVAAETITNVCSTDDPDNNDFDDDDSEAESVHDFDKESNSSANNIVNDKLPIEILEPIKSLGLVEKLWQRAQPIAENVQGLLKETENGLTKKVQTLRISSLLCLQNLCNIMTTEDLGGPSAIYGVWIDLGQQVFMEPPNSAILEASTALMRATIVHLRVSPQLFKQMTENDLKLMLDGVQICTEPEIRANWLRMLGILGCLLPEPLVKVIIAFILEQSLQEADAWTLSEAIDTLMDMFSDNDWNQICYELNLAQKIKELEKSLKSKLRQQKRELSDRYLAVSTVRTNLTRFTKYIESEQRKYKPAAV